MAGVKNLLFEIGVEELPAGFLFPALDQLAQLAERGLREERLDFRKISCFGTPRRLGLIVEDLVTCQPDIVEKITGPAAGIAFDAQGNPTKAGEGFARSKGLEPAALRVEKTDKGEYVVAERLIRGKDTITILEDMLPGFITSLHFPKSMRWADFDLRFARPVRWIAALLGGDVVSFTVAGVQSGAESRGHRFMSPGRVRVEAEPEKYLAALEKVHVIADPEKRREMLAAEIAGAATAAGGGIVEDRDLVELNTNLVEFPTAVCGSFDREFLMLPESVLITCMKEHQKYFAVQDSQGGIMPAFVAVNNTLSSRRDIVTTGHQRVLRARLSDAAFFYSEDTKKRLEDFVPGLGGMVFHRKLGTLLDKTRRVQALAEYIAAEAAPEHIESAKRAAWLCKADLLTEMVGEFASLQGIMGMEYARLSGESEDVAMAIAEHYMPVRAGGDLPSSMTGAIVSLADKMDTICSTFAIGLRPSGTQDPYALRRLALGIIHVVENAGGTGVNISLVRMVEQAVVILSGEMSEVSAQLKDDVLAFFRVRFINDLAARGFDSDVIEAAVRVDFNVIPDCVERACALKAVRRRPEFGPISTAFKRVMNILKEYEGGIPVESALFREKEEKALYQAYTGVKEQLASVLPGNTSGADIKRDSYVEALIILLSIKSQIDSFFDNVMVMADDPGIRNNRLALLWHISRLFLRIGDLSAIVVD